MGITKLADLIRAEAPGAVSHRDISDYSEKVIALDTSIIVNQFRAKVPHLSLLMGFFYRTLTFLEHDIKPVFVIDGKPPVEKTAVVREAMFFTQDHPLTSSQIKDCLQLLKHMGVPVIQAPGDAEALCAQLVKDGTVDAVASEDMDTLPFGASVLLRGLNASRDTDVTEYSLAKLVEQLQISHEELIDLCILLGCDYCDKIPGLGPKKALKLIQKHRCIENVVLHVNRQTHPVPHFWKYKEARKIFLDTPHVPTPELTWTEPDEEALVFFLCRTKHNREERVRRRMEKYRETRKNRQEERDMDKMAGHSRQTRMEDFWRVTRKRSVAAADSSSSSNKRPKLK
uniref:Zgc:110269 n=1 Tax=Salarias fasciatus TaxID=181472 RepID=A0A672JC22_SALFA